MKHFISIVFCILLPFINILYAAQLTVTVSDATSTPIKDVNVKLECLSGDPFLDSMYTDSLGGYSFTGFPMGSYRISLSKTGYIPKDSLFVLGSSDYVINFVLVDSVSGTYHSGEESGVWLPSGNTHWIVGDVTVTDSLYIAPGCSVVFIELNRKSTKILLNASLHIGSINGDITYISHNGHIACDDENVNGYIENAICSSGVDIKCNVCIVNNSNFRSFKISKSNNLTINNSTFNSFTIDSSKNVYILKTILPQGDNTQVHIIGDKVVLDTVQLKAGLHGSSNSLIAGMDSLIIMNSAINGYTYYMQMNFFNTELQLEGGNILINYCTSKKLDLRLMKHSSVKIEHSNIQKFIPYEINIDQDSIINDIIDSLKLGNLPDTIYKSPFFYNIITYLSKWDFHFVGLTENIQVNANGDSCDLWFNMKTDPLFADTNKIVLFNNSPAIRAASDGTNIGVYQGDGVGILADNHQINPAKIVLIIKKSSILFNLPKSGNTTLKIYNIKGRLLETLVDSNKQAGSYSINWNSNRYGSGVYFLKLSINGSSVSRKITIIR